MNNLASPQATIRSLVDDLTDELHRIQSIGYDLQNHCFGPIPAEASPDKDGRSDLRAKLERALATAKNVGADLTRVNNGLGIPSGAEAQSGLSESRAVGGSRY